MLTAVLKWLLKSVDVDISLHEDDLTVVLWFKKTQVAKWSWDILKDGLKER